MGLHSRAPATADYLFVFVYNIQQSSQERQANHTFSPVTFSNRGRRQILICLLDPFPLAGL
jgi:hypothetical protein